MNHIGLYNNIKSVTNSREVSIDYFLDDIKDGRWQDVVISYRKDSEHLQKKELNEKYINQFPLATISGTFKSRSVDGLDKHSGFICIDVDNIENIKEVRSKLFDSENGEVLEPHLYSMFYSRSGNGLALIFKIRPSKHRESFDGLAEYLFETYGLIVDQSCKDVSRARFVSYDPECFINQGAETFVKYPEPLPKALKKVQKAVFVQSDFDDIVREIEYRRIDLTQDSYQNFLRVAFAFCDELGEVGRSYFHAVCQYSIKYDQQVADKQYDVCLKRGKSGVSIASFYYMAKNAGIPIMSQQTKTVIQTAIQAKKQKRNISDTVALVSNVQGLDASFAEPIIKQVFENEIEDVSDSIIDELELYLSTNHSLILNSLTQMIEDNGKILGERQLNSIFLSAKKVIDKIDYPIFKRLINSEYVGEYNPLINFLNKHKDRKPSGTIRKLAETIDGPSTQCRGLVEMFLKRWLIAIISSIYGDPKPLRLVLTGSKMGTGKTQFFRRLLPKELSAYYGESKLDDRKDDAVLMTSKLILMDDEMSGKSTQDETKFKTMSSKDIISIRRPYAEFSVDLKRLAILCATTNEDEILNDPHGNRRTLPIKVHAINFELYNAIDKTDLLIEAYHLFIAGETADLTVEERAQLDEVSVGYQETSVEAEAIQMYYKPAEAHIGVFYTTTQLKIELERFTMQKFSVNRLGQELRRLKFDIVYHQRKRGFWVEKHTPETLF